LNIPFGSDVRNRVACPPATSSAAGLLLGCERGRGDRGRGDRVRQRGRFGRAPPERVEVREVETGELAGQLRALVGRQMPPLGEEVGLPEPFEGGAEFRRRCHGIFFS
jgi:hypothetical protein